MLNIRPAAARRRLRRRQALPFCPLRGDTVPLAQQWRRTPESPAAAPADTATTARPHIGHSPVI